MKRYFIVSGLLLAGTLQAAEPPPATTAEPAVTTSPAASAAPAAAGEQGRDKPRRQQLTVDPAEPAVTTAASPPASAPGTRPASRAADRIELDATQITGNAELPRVMYVVPWKRPELGELTGRPARSLLDEVLAPVDRDVFRRQNRYYEALQPDAQEQR